MQIRETKRDLNQFYCRLFEYFIEKINAIIEIK